MVSNLYPPFHAPRIPPLTVSDFIVGPGLKAIVESIDSRSDFKTFMQNFAVARGSVRGPRREGPYEDGFVSSCDTSASRLSPLNISYAVRRQTPALPPHVLALQQAQTQSSVATSNVAQGDTNSNQSMPGAYTPTVPSHATFGVELGEQMVRDGTEIPKVVEKCALAIEEFGELHVGAPCDEIAD